MLWQGRMPRASGDRPVLNRRVTPVALPHLLLQWNPVWAPSLAHISCGAEEAGMKGWRERVADVFTEKDSIAAKKESAPGPVPADFIFPTSLDSFPNPIRRCNSPRSRPTLSRKFGIILAF